MRDHNRAEPPLDKYADSDERWRFCQFSEMAAFKHAINGFPRGDGGRVIFKEQNKSKEDKREVQETVLAKVIRPTTCLQQTGDNCWIYSVWNMLHQGDLYATVNERFRDHVEAYVKALMNLGTSKAPFVPDLTPLWKAYIAMRKEHRPESSELYHVCSFSNQNWALYVMQALFGKDNVKVWDFERNPVKLAYTQLEGGYKLDDAVMAIFSDLDHTKAGIIAVQCDDMGHEVAVVKRVDGWYLYNSSDEKVQGRDIISGYFVHTEPPVPRTTRTTRTTRANTALEVAQRAVRGATDVSAHVGAR